MSLKAPVSLERGVSTLLLLLTATYDRDMRTKKLSDLPIFSGQLDLDNDFAIVYNETLPETSRAARAPISRFADVLVLLPLSSGKINASGTLNLSLDDHDVLALSTNGSLNLYLPEPDPAKTKSFIVFSDSPIQNINLFDNENNFQFTMSFSNSCLFFEAYSIEDDWYIIKGLTQVVAEVVISDSYPGVESNIIPIEIIVLISDAYNGVLENRLLDSIENFGHSYISSSLPGIGNIAHIPIEQSYHLYDSLSHSGVGNVAHILIDESFHLYDSVSYPSLANIFFNQI